MPCTLRKISLLPLLVLAALFVTVAPPPIHAQSTDAYTGEYFNNPNLSGPPVFVRQDPDINFDWGAAAPDPNLPVNNFSVRWTRWYNVNPAGSYTLTMMSDDGSRLWVDGTLVIDLWWDHGPLSRIATLNLTAGYHLIRMEYYDHANSASARLQIEPAGYYPDWKGEYFDNQTLEGSPTLTQNDSEVNFNWGSGSPDPEIPADHFSVRWTRDQYFDGGTYRFTAVADDGVRVWVGSTLLIDQWHAATQKTYSGDITLASGTMPLRVEYYENTGNALVQVAWTSVTANGSAWSGQYFSNPNLKGTPVLTRADASLDFDWGAHSPAAGIPADNFSAQWDATRRAPATGFYTVYAAADDAVRVTVDGNVLIDEWHDASQEVYAATVYLVAGDHRWHVDYYEHLGDAKITVQIVPGVSPVPMPDGDITVDDGGTGWLASGSPSNWRTTPNGSNGRSFWTFNNAFMQPLYNWVRWYPSLPQARNYEVLAYIPGGVATTRSARYWIAHAGAFTLRTLPQALYTNQWVSLGTYYFSASGDEYVSLADVTYECFRCYTIVFDALKFRPR